MSFNKQGIRICDHCGKEMYEGYCIEDGCEHYCSDECLHQHYSHEEYMEMYDDGYGSTYWTEWYDEIGMRNTGMTKCDSSQ